MPIIFSFHANDEHQPIPEGVDCKKTCLADGADWLYDVHFPERDSRDREKDYRERVIAIGRQLVVAARTNNWKGYGFSSESDEEKKVVKEILSQLPMVFSFCAANERQSFPDGMHLLSAPVHDEKGGFFYQLVFPDYGKPLKKVERSQLEEIGKSLLALVRTNSWKGCELQAPYGSEEGRKIIIKEFLKSFRKKDKHGISLRFLACFESEVELLEQMRTQVRGQETKYCGEELARKEKLHAAVSSLPREIPKFPQLPKDAVPAINLSTAVLTGPEGQRAAEGLEVSAASEVLIVPEGTPEVGGHDLKGATKSDSELSMRDCESCCSSEEEGKGIIRDVIAGITDALVHFNEEIEVLREEITRSKCSHVITMGKFHGKMTERNLQVRGLIEQLRSSYLPDFIEQLIVTWCGIQEKKCEKVEDAIRKCRDEFPQGFSQLTTIQQFRVHRKTLDGIAAELNIFREFGREAEVVRLLHALDERILGEPSSELGVNLTDSRKEKECMDCGDCEAGPSTPPKMLGLAKLVQGMLEALAEGKKGAPANARPSQSPSATGSDGERTPVAGEGAVSEHGGEVVVDSVSVPLLPQPELDTKTSSAESEGGSVTDRSDELELVEAIKKCLPLIECIKSPALRNLILSKKEYYRIAQRLWADPNLLGTLNSYLTAARVEQLPRFLQRTFRVSLESSDWESVKVDVSLPEYFETFDRAEKQISFSYQMFMFTVKQPARLGILERNLGYAREMVGAKGRSEEQPTGLIAHVILYASLSEVSSVGSLDEDARSGLLDKVKNSILKNIGALVQICHTGLDGDDRVNFVGHSYEAARSLLVNLNVLAVKLPAEFVAEKTSLQSLYVDIRTRALDCLVKIIPCPLLRDFFSSYHDEIEIDEWLLSNPLQRYETAVKLQHLVMEKQSPSPLPSAVDVGGGGGEAVSAVAPAPGIKEAIADTVFNCLLEAIECPPVRDFFRHYREQINFPFICGNREKEVSRQIGALNLRVRTVIAEGGSISTTDWIGLLVDFGFERNFLRGSRSSRDLRSSAGSPVVAGPADVPEAAEDDSAPIAQLKDDIAHYALARPVGAVANPIIVTLLAPPVVLKKSGGNETLTVVRDISRSGLSNDRLSKLGIELTDREFACVAAVQRLIPADLLSSEPARESVPAVAALENGFVAIGRQVGEFVMALRAGIPAVDIQERIAVLITRLTTDFEQAKDLHHELKEAQRGKEGSNAGWLLHNAMRLLDHYQEEFGKLKHALDAAWEVRVREKIAQVEGEHAAEKEAFDEALRPIRAKAERVRKLAVAFCGMNTAEALREDKTSFVQYMRRCADAKSFVVREIKTFLEENQQFKASNVAYIAYSRVTESSESTPIAVAAREKCLAMSAEKDVRDLLRKIGEAPIVADEIPEELSTRVFYEDLTCAQMAKTLWDRSRQLFASLKVEGIAKPRAELVQTEEAHDADDAIRIVGAAKTEYDRDGVAGSAKDYHAYSNKLSVHVSKDILGTARNRAAKIAAITNWLVVARILYDEGDYNSFVGICSAFALRTVEEDILPVIDGLNDFAKFQLCRLTWLFGHISSSKTTDPQVRAKIIYLPAYIEALNKFWGMFEKRDVSADSGIAGSLKILQNMLRLQEGVRRLQTAECMADVAAIGLVDARERLVGAIDREDSSLSATTFLDKYQVSREEIDNPAFLFWLESGADVPRSVRDLRGVVPVLAKAHESRTKKSTMLLAAKTLSEKLADALHIAEFPDEVAARVKSYAWLPCVSSEVLRTLINNWLDADPTRRLRSVERDDGKRRKTKFVIGDLNAAVLQVDKSQAKADVVKALGALGISVSDFGLDEASLESMLSAEQKAKLVIVKPALQMTLSSGLGFSDVEKFCGEYQAFSSALEAVLATLRRFQGNATAMEVLARCEWKTKLDEREREFDDVTHRLNIEQPKETLSEFVSVGKKVATIISPSFGPSLPPDNMRFNNVEVRRLYNEHKRIEAFFDATGTNMVNVPKALTSFLQKIPVSGLLRDLVNAYGWERQLADKVQELQVQLTNLEQQRDALLIEVIDLAEVADSVYDSVPEEATVVKIENSCSLKWHHLYAFCKAPACEPFRNREELPMRFLVGLMRAQCYTLFNNSDSLDNELYYTAFYVAAAQLLQLCVTDGYELKIPVGECVQRLHLLQSCFKQVIEVLTLNPVILDILRPVGIFFGRMATAYKRVPLDNSLITMAYREGISWFLHAMTGLDDSRREQVIRRQVVEILCRTIFSFGIVCERGKTEEFTTEVSTRITELLRVANKDEREDGENGVLNYIDSIVRVLFTSTPVLRAAAEPRSPDGPPRPDVPPPPSGALARVVTSVDVAQKRQKFNRICEDIRAGISKIGGAGDNYAECARLFSQRGEGAAVAAPAEASSADSVSPVRRNQGVGWLLIELERLIESLDSEAPSPEEQSLKAEMESMLGEFQKNKDLEEKVPPFLRTIFCLQVEKEIPEILNPQEGGNNRAGTRVLNGLEMSLAQVGRLTRNQMLRFTFEGGRYFSQGRISAQYLLYTMQYKAFLAHCFCCTATDAPGDNLRESIQSLFGSGSDGDAIKKVLVEAFCGMAMDGVYPFTVAGRESLAPKQDAGWIFSPIWAMQNSEHRAEEFVDMTPEQEGIFLGIIVKELKLAKQEHSIKVRQPSPSEVGIDRLYYRLRLLKDAEDFCRSLPPCEQGEFKKHISARWERAKVEKVAEEYIAQCEAAFTAVFGGVDATVSAILAKGEIDAKKIFETIDFDKFVECESVVCSLQPELQARYQRLLRAMQLIRSDWHIVENIDIPETVPVAQCLYKRAESMIDAARYVVTKYWGVNFSSDTDGRSRQQWFEDNIASIWRNTFSSSSSMSVEIDFAVLMNKTVLKMHSGYKPTNRNTGVKLSEKAVKDILVAADHLVQWERGHHAVTTVFKRKSDDRTYTYIQTERPVGGFTPEQILEYLKIFKEPLLQWFLALPDIIQHFLSAKLEKFKEPFLAAENKLGFCEMLVPEFNATLNLPPPILRSVPGLANLWEHTLIILDTATGNEVFRSTRLRSATATPHAVPDAAAASSAEELSTRQRLTLQNVRQLLEPALKDYVERLIAMWGEGCIASGELQVPVLLQTLVSPAKHKTFSGGDSEFLMVEELLAVVAKGGSDVPMMIGGREVRVIPRLLAVNHMVNGMRSAYLGVGAASKYPLSTEKIRAETVILDSLKYFFLGIESWVSAHKTVDSAFWIAVSAILVEVKKEQVSGIASFLNGECLQIVEGDEFHIRQIKLMCQAARIGIGLAQQQSLDLHWDILTLAAVEQIVSGVAGVSWASCKSGKDRTAIVTMWVDAMVEYSMEMRGDLPNLSEHSARTTFAIYFADFFMSYHHQYIAEQTTSGVHWLKSIANTLPDEVYIAIAKRVMGDAEVVRLQKDPRMHNLANLAGLNKIGESDTKFSLPAAEVVKAVADAKTKAEAEKAAKAAKAAEAAEAARDAAAESAPFPPPPVAAEPGPSSVPAEETADRASLTPPLCTPKSGASSASARVEHSKVAEREFQLLSMHGYDDRQISMLLQNLDGKDGVAVLPPLPVATFEQRGNVLPILQDLITGSEKPTTVVCPLNIGGGTREDGTAWVHWVALYMEVERNSDGVPKLVNVKYYEPLGESLAAAWKSPILQMLQQINSGLEEIEINGGVSPLGRYQYPSQGNTCGPWVVNILRTLVETYGSPFNIHDMSEGGLRNYIQAAFLKQLVELQAAGFVLSEGGWSSRDVSDRSAPPLPLPSEALCPSRSVSEDDPLIRINQQFSCFCKPGDRQVGVGAPPSAVDTEPEMVGDDSDLEEAQKISLSEAVRLLEAEKREYFSLQPTYVPFVDGDCLFAAVAAFYTHDRNNGEEIAVIARLMRTMAMNILEARDPLLTDAIIAGITTRMETPENTLNCGGVNTPFNSVEKYIKLMRRDRTWATEFEINALSHALNRPIVVLMPGNAGDQVVEEDRYYAEPIFLSVVNGNHYIPLFVPNDQQPQDIVRAVNEFHSAEVHPAFAAVSASADGLPDDECTRDSGTFMVIDAVMRGRGCSTEEDEGEKPSRFSQSFAGTSPSFFGHPDGGAVTMSEPAEDSTHEWNGEEVRGWIDWLNGLLSPEQNTALSDAELNAISKYQSFFYTNQDWTKPVFLGHDEVYAVFLRTYTEISNKFNLETGELKVVAAPAPG